MSLDLVDEHDPAVLDDGMVLALSEVQRPEARVHVPQDVNDERHEHLRARAQVANGELLTILLDREAVRVDAEHLRVVEEVVVQQGNHTLDDALRLVALRGLRVGIELPMVEVHQPADGVHQRSVVAE